MVWASRADIFACQCSYEFKLSEGGRQIVCRFLGDAVEFSVERPWYVGGRMNFYSASVAVLWLTACRAGADRTVSRRRGVDVHPRPLGGRADLPLRSSDGFNNSDFIERYRRTEN